jgi:eukaryotic-like serine/threonine-protein kinase
VPIDPKRVQAVFVTAIDCDPVDRAAALDRECSNDAELRRRVEALLEAHDQANSLLDQPVGPARNGFVPIERPDENGPDRTEARSSLGVFEGSNPTIHHGPESDFTIARVHSSEMPDRGLPDISGYEILEELGRGGMGVVYRARQIRLDRPCALKMILGGVHSRPEAASRFLAEAQAIARLQHPHIVQIHYIGETDGLPFFELEYIDGGSLDTRLDGTPWPARRAAGLVELLAGAIAEAHRQGIVHRDLKPGNILLMADGTPKITDFGLAKSLGTESGLTATDSIMGSPSYMAPEQAAGQTKQLGPLSDLYALGATLYELLTGRPPFRGATILETLEQVRTIEPVPPSRLVPGLPRDVETIALKCLQKEPGKRYDSASSLALDLRRFLDGEPIVARPVPFWERGWRWCRRHPAPAFLSGIIFLITALGLAGILWQWEEALKARNEAVVARDQASRRALAEAKAHQEAETTLVDMYTTNGISAGDQGEHARAALWFANAARRAEADPDRRHANAVRARTWGRQALTPVRAIVTAGSRPAGLIFHPGGRYLITKTTVGGAARDARLTLWDLSAERSLPFPGGSSDVPAAAWSPDGKVLAVGLDDGNVIVASFPSGDGTRRIKLPERIRLLSYSPDGRYLAIAAGNAARVWDVQSQMFATPELLHPAEVTNLAFHPEGRFLATGCLDNQGRLFAVPGNVGIPSWTPVPHAQVPIGSAWFPEFFSPPLFVDNGRGLITYSGKGGLSWRSVETGVIVRTLEAPGMASPIPGDDSRFPVAFAAIELSADGRYLAVVGFQSRRVRLFEVATGQPVGPVLEHENTVLSAAFSPDGNMLLTGSTDNSVRQWAVPGGELLSRPLNLHRPVNLVGFAPQGRLLATQDGELVRLWALPEEGLPSTSVPLDGKSSFAAISPDGTLLIPTGMSFQGESTLRGTRAFHVANGRPGGPLLRPGGLLVDAAFSPNGESMATVGARVGAATEGQEVVLWDWKGGREGWRVTLPSDPRSLSFDRDGRRLAVLCGGGEVLIFQADTGREVLRWGAHDAEPAHHWVNNGKVEFSRDGRSVLTWGMGNDVRVWDAESGRLRYPPLRHRDKCHDLQFSPDGRLMALASYDGSVRVREFETGAVIVELPAHPDIVYSATFSPDGKLLATACRDHTVRVWDWRAGRLVCPPFEHAKDAMSAIFTPDGRWVLSASVDGTARVWDWRTGKPITPSLKIQGEPLSLAVTPDGKHVVVGGGQPSLAVLDLGELAQTHSDSAALVLRAELVAGQRLHPGGGTVNLSAEEWIDRWRTFRKQSPDAHLEGFLGEAFPPQPLAP